MKNWKKIICLILCLMFLTPIVSQAQLNSVPISSDQIGGPVREDGAAVSELGRVFGLGNFLNSFNSAMSTINKAQCYTETAKKALNVAEKVDSWSFGGLKLLTGDAGEASMIKGKITALDAAKGCVEGKLKDVKATPIATLTQGQLRQSLIQQYTTELATIQKRLDELNAQYRNATRSLWKAVLTKSLLATTKAVTAKLANNLTHKFKINNYLDYADAVASQVYTTQLIRNNVKSGGDQLIARSILTNPLVRNEVQPAIFDRADKALGFDPDDLDLDDPNFYQKSFQVGSGNTNAFLMQVQALDSADQMQAQGLESAKTEINHGGGFKGSRTCHGNLSEQAAIDREYQAINNEMTNRAKLLKDLKDYRDNMRNFTTQQAQQIDADIAKAQRDFNNASKKLAVLPQKYPSPVLEICDELSLTPAELVNKGIDKAFSSFAGKMSDYNDNNLPFFVNFISDIGSQIGNSLIFGGSVGNTLLKESSEIAQATSLGINFAKDVQMDNLAKGVSFSYEKSSNFSDAYILTWEVIDVKDANYVTIKGTGISDTQRLPLSGSLEIKTSASNTYLLKVFDSKGKALTSVSQDLKVETANPYLSSSGPMIRGVNIIKPINSIRGPIGVSPRGSY